MLVLILFGQVWVQAENDWVRFFLQQRPTIQEMVFSKITPALQLGSVGATQVCHYLVRWQSEDRFLFAESLALEHLGRPLRAPIGSTKWYAAEPGRWWFMEGAADQLLVHVWNTTEPPDKPFNPVLSTIECVRSVEIEPALCLGISYAPLGKVMWSEGGRNYHFTSEVLKVWAMGEIIRDAQGRVEKVLHSFSLPIGVEGKIERKNYRHIIRYSYEGDQSNSLPARFPHSGRIELLQDPSSRFIICDLLFHRLVITTPPIIQESFSDIAMGRPMTMYFFSNRSEYVFDGKRWVARPDHQALRARSEVSRSREQVLRFFVVALLLAPTILLAVWLRRSTAQ